MASIEEVWGKPFPTKGYNMTSKHAQKEDPRDAEKEGRVAPTPIHRSAAAIQRNRKTIDDLTKSLPIVHNDEEADSNYAPVKIGNTREHFTATKAEFTKPFFPKDPGLDFAYAPPSFQESAHEMKLNRIIRMIEQNKTGYETPSSHDMALYVFTGVMALFVLDTFVNLGRRMG